MPILNPAITTWSTAYVAYPYVDPSTNDIQWGSTKILIDSLKIDRVVDRGKISLARGGPYPNVWKMGDAYWEIEFRTPMLVPFYADPDTGRGGYFDQARGVCATLPLTVSPGEEWYKPLILTGFVSTALRPYVMMSPPDSIKKYWHDADSNFYDRDIIVTGVTVNIGEEESSLTVKLISTVDPRGTFYLTDQEVSEEDIAAVGRVMKPWDIYVPSGYVGSDIVISEPEASKVVPTYLDTTLLFSELTPVELTTPPPEDTDGDGDLTDEATVIPPVSEAASPGYIFMMRSLEFSVEVEVNRKRSLGVPSARPLLIADAVSITGSMKMVPFYRDEMGWLSHTDPYSLTIHQPAGWMADVQAMDDREITDRPPGKYYRVFEKSPTADTAKPLFVGFAMRGGAGSWFWGMDGKSATTPLGPASVNRVISSQPAGQFHELTVQFTTDPGNFA